MLLSFDWGILVKLFTTTITGLFLLPLLGITAPVSAVVVNFPDANLEAEVRDELGINLDGSEVVTLTTELDSLNRLDVTGLWGSFDSASQSSLIAWDIIEGNTLVVPEGSAFTMIAFGLMSLICLRHRK